VHRTAPFVVAALLTFGALTPARAYDFSTVTLVQNLVATGDATQCYGGAHGRITASGGSFSAPMFLDTDGRTGGCNYQIGLVDPYGELAKRGFKLTMQFSTNGDAGQCGGIGTYEVPVSKSLDRVRFTPYILIDTDNRAYGCLLRFTLAGSDVALDVNFRSNMDAGQCGNQGTHSISGGQWVEIFLDMDDRPGGCYLSLRLRSGVVPSYVAMPDAPKAPPPSASAPPAPAPAAAAVPARTPAPPAMAPSAGKRVALVIGNGAYANAPKLPNPPNDAHDVAAALKRLGFDTILALNADRPGMDDAEIRFARAARDADVALFYYSGHALQFNGINYLMPVDAKLTDEADLRRLSRVDDLVADLQQAKNLRILVLDSCRDNPFVEDLKRSVGLSRGVSVQRGLAKLDNPQGMIVSYATQAGRTAEDGQGRNSPYTAAFLKNIEAPQEIGTVFRRIASDVYDTTNRVQLPEISFSIIGEFYLGGAAPVPRQ
jgi:hypothetical protein